MNAENWLNDKEYEALLQLYHNCNNAFVTLPEYWKEAFYARLYGQPNTAGKESKNGR
jgi:hypothetical protein